jgi:hypothetical protein
MAADEDDPIRATERQMAKHYLELFSDLSARSTESSGSRHLRRRSTQRSSRYSPRTRRLKRLRNGSQRFSAGSRSEKGASDARRLGRSVLAKSISLAHPEYPFQF